MPKSELADRLSAGEEAGSMSKPELTGCKSEKCSSLGTIHSRVKRNARESVPCGKLDADTHASQPDDVHQYRVPGLVNCDAPLSLTDKP